MDAQNTERTPQEAEGKYNKAARAELEKLYDKAFRLYLAAAEDFLYLGQRASDGRLKVAYKTQAKKALERAERLKAARPDLAPVVKDDFSIQQQLAAVQKSSSINGGYFPLWDLADDTGPSDQPPLSPEQLSQGATWAKPGDDYSIYESEDAALTPHDIAQHVISDCSVCGAIAAVIGHHRRFGSKIVLSALHPQDSNVIDDCLPAYPDGRLMCMSSGTKRILWPALVEKAYMKLAGGYDFAGSDSSTDLHALSGWIPEYIDMKSPQFQREKTWARLRDGFNKGLCIFTLGTGVKVAEGQAPMTLLPAHCYTVLDIHETEEQRVMSVFDPWIPLDNEGAASPSSDTVGSRATPMDWDVICNVFDGVYLNWDPESFSSQFKFHGSWTKDSREQTLPGDDTTSTHHRAHIRFECAADGDHNVWILLTRHVTDNRRTQEYISLFGYNSTEDISSVSLSLAKKGEYTNSPHVLVRTKVSRAEPVLNLFASYDGQLDTVGFTLTVYSDSHGSWIRDTPKYSYHKTVTGTLTDVNSGGNHTLPTYYLNPQYHLRVHPDTRGLRDGARDAKAAVSFAASCSRKLPIHIAVAWSQGERLSELGHNELALSSGPHSYGYACASGHIPPGEYTLILSPFEPNQLGEYTVRMESSHKFEISAIMPEGAGMFKKPIRGAWTEDTAGGSPSFNQYARNPAFEIQVKTATHAKFRLQLAEPGPPTPLNLTLFRADAPGTPVATSGPYSDAAGGVVIADVALAPGTTYRAVPSTYAPGTQAAFRLLVYSAQPGLQVTPVAPAGAPAGRGGTR